VTSRVLTSEELEAELRHIGHSRYHHLHPFHRLLHDGKLSRGQVQAWALNRYYYQSQIPVKDAMLLARFRTAALRREWRRRLEDQDGSEAVPGGGARWLELATHVGLDAHMVESAEAILPGTRFAVDAYVHFVRDRTVLEAVASSLTELFAPKVIAERVSGMLANYAWVTPETLAYFTPRLTQAPRDSDFALQYVKEHADTLERQEQVLAALRFKCDVLWAQLDALHYAYVTPGLIPAGAFEPAVA
jgi:pyrroloquinoline-quinone synthase